MVADAERYKAEDKKVADRVAAKNKLEQYAYSLRNSIEDQKVKDKLSEDDVKKIEAAVKDTQNWLDNNASAEVEEFEAHQKELEKLAMPIMSKIYAEGGAGGAPGAGGFPGGADFGGAAAGGAGAGAGPSAGSSKGPTVEEVD
jgi:L1 cell adhesion molecule like protein